MPGLLTREGLNFLYRKEEGHVDRTSWWLGALLLAAILFVLVMIWLVVRPWANRGLDERAMIDAPTIVAYIYVMFFSFAVLLIAVSYVNLTSKRFQTRGFKTLPAGLAGIPLLLLLITGALNWLNIRIAGAVPQWIVYAVIFACVASLVWHVVELGLRGDRREV